MTLGCDPLMIVEGKVSSAADACTTSSPAAEQPVAEATVRVRCPGWRDDVGLATDAKGHFAWGNVGSQRRTWLATA
jgi:hypothetical protein